MNKVKVNNLVMDDDDFHELVYMHINYFIQILLS